MLARIHLVATLAWTALAAGAVLGFLAGEVLGLRQSWVALAWTVGVLAAFAPGGGPRSKPVAREDGQAAVEFAALVLLTALALGALVTFGPRIDGRSFAGFLAFRITCAAQRNCHSHDSFLTRAYGPRDAALVREHAPNIVYETGERQLPVDWRRCRRPACADAPDERDLDVHRSDAGERPTVFTRVLRMGAGARGRRGRTYLQYWLYYPDSNTTWAGSDRGWDAAWLAARAAGLVRRGPAYPGFHRDDWEAYVVRLDADGTASARASSHMHWQGCKEHRCRNEWTAPTGWMRVSRGSHAGHIPLRHELRGRPPPVSPRQVPVPWDRRARVRWVPLLPGHDLDERTSTSEGLRLIPLETHDRSGYRPNGESVIPPWRKEAYRDPESDRS